MLTLRERAIAHIPHCLSKIKVQIQSFNKEQDTVRFSLSNGNDYSARVFGYDLRDYNKEYEGDLLFISPVTLEWQENMERTLIFDSKLHGYHGEMNASAKFRGSGEPKVFKCSQCPGELFTLQAQFDYYSFPSEGLYYRGCGGFAPTKGFHPFNPFN